MAIQGKKTDSNTIAKVVAAKVANPDASLRDIAKEVPVSHHTVNEILKKEAGELLTSSDKAKSLLEINMEIINIGAEKVAKAIVDMDPKDIREAKEMQAIVETAFKQNQLLLGQPTENLRFIDNVEIV